MITGFEKETEPLNEIELTMVPYICDIIKGREGKKSAITNKEICQYMNSDVLPKLVGDKVSLRDVRLRK